MGLRIRSFSFSEAEVSLVPLQRLSSLGLSVFAQIPGLLFAVISSIRPVGGRLSQPIKAAADGIETCQQK